MVIAIDPSFSSTGIAAVGSGVLESYATISAPGHCYESPAACDKAALVIAKQVIDFAKRNCPTEFIIEVPALRSGTGGYLGVLHGILVSKIYSEFHVPITLVPPNACDSFIKNKAHSKSYIVNYCKQLEWVPNKRINNDVCTAVVLAHLSYAIKAGEYKNSFSVIES